MSVSVGYGEAYLSPFAVDSYIGAIIMERFYLLVVGWPKTLLSILLGLTCIATLFAKDIRFDSSIDGLLGRNEPARRYYDGVRDLFGSDEVAVVGVVADDIYTETTLSLIRRLT